MNRTSFIAAIGGASVATLVPLHSKASQLTCFHCKEKFWGNEKNVFVKFKFRQKEYKKLTSRADLKFSKYLLISKYLLKFSKYLTENPEYTTDSVTCNFFACSRCWNKNFFIPMLHHYSAREIWHKGTLIKTNKDVMLPRDPKQINAWCRRFKALN